MKTPVETIEEIINHLRRCEFAQAEAIAVSAFDKFVERPEDGTPTMEELAAVEVLSRGSPWMKHFREPIKELRTAFVFRKHWSASPEALVQAAHQYGGFTEWDKECGIHKAASFIMEGWVLLGADDWVNQYRHSVEREWKATLRSQSITLDLGGGDIRHIDVTSLPKARRHPPAVVSWANLTVDAIVERIRKVRRADD